MVDVRVPFVLPALIGALVAGAAYGERAPLPIPEPARPTAEMVEWARRHVPVGSSEERLQGLLEALSRDPELHLAYDAGFTATAAEVFAAGRFNCLSFAHLFVGLARTLGLDVDYLQVPAQRFVRDGDLILAAGHVTVGYGTGPLRRVLDFGSIAAADLTRAERISDERAVALHWLNLGAQNLVDDELEEAEGKFRRALTLDPRLGAAWTNLGVVRRRQGFPDEAEAMYRRAIEAEGEHLTAYENLFTLLVSQGREDAARDLERLIARRDPRNPFAWLALGDFNLGTGRAREAGRLLRRAYRLAPDDPEVLAARGEAALATGRPRRARRWLERAQRVAPEQDRVVRLARSLERAADLASAEAGRESSS